ncbi:EF-hand domain-containing protein [Caulobacter segnis]|uniref:EF-hand domain-containing protein n=1 Tax=Caulobacter segnis TaxID=88688 RepID=A0A2W5VBJ3_9CAUL|nr:hypothetical protein [Caulobacter segnis]PZR36007.1 MAG: hypothetical protein DI526_05295 [Caulobacter segnis]
MKRDPKKSETLQVRLPHGMKRDFMQRCEAENRAASDLVRDFIEGYLARPVEILTSEKAVMIRRTFVYPTLAAASLLGAVFVLAPSASQATSLRDDFAAMDQNKDGFIVASEYQPPEDGVTYSVKSTSSKPGATRISSAASADETLSSLDQDGDHRLSFEEYRFMRTGAAMAIMKRGDRDQDHRLTQAEYIEGSTLPDAAVAKIKAQAPGVELAIAQMRGKAGARFERLDADRDGTLTLEEMTPS